MPQKCLPRKLLTLLIIISIAIVHFFTVDKVN